ncbi:MAG: hypothetical protein ACN6O8_09895 [Achromobacter sp.]|uniref:hypothetical protein n=1 Tax=Achromobacter sp. TaxID=134375 RepID=UPI003D068D99
MSYLSRQRQGRRALLLAGLILFPLAAAQAAAPTANQANVNLETDINTMAVHVGQSAPLPPGGCNPGYAWHTTYGGCRIAQEQSESTQCPVGQTGTRARTRVAYALQADPQNVVYEDWGTWAGDCRASSAPASGDCRYEPGKTEIVFFRLPGGDPVTVMQWQGAIIVNSAVHTYGQIPGYEAVKGLAKDGWLYRTGTLAPNQGDSFDTTSYELCREPVDPPLPSQVNFTRVQAPDALHCTFPWFTVRATFPDGTPAKGIKLTWTPLHSVQNRRKETVTDAKGEATYSVARTTAGDTIRVHWGKSSMDLKYFCIGGT